MNYIDHLKGLAADERQAEIESKISDTKEHLLNAETVSSQIASTNATGWGVDEYDVLEVDVSRRDEIRVRIRFSISGGQEDGKPFCGTLIEGEAMAIIGGTGDVRYTNVTAQRESEDDDEEPEG